MINLHYALYIADKKGSHYLQSADTPEKLRVSSAVVLRYAAQMGVDINALRGQVTVHVMRDGETVYNGAFNPGKKIKWT